ncbi:hypothetical protein WKW50_23540 [Ochrobactrum sp. GPK 3]|uniref:hypothetical protein n=1 Tax=Brucella sp. 22210 TaxID=3453892 RepID=UPI00313851C5
MRHFKNLRTGKVFNVVIDTGYGISELKEIKLKDPAMSAGKIGSALIGCELNDDGKSFRLLLFLLEVRGHRNIPNAINPHPGTGTLLMYLACQEGLTMGASAISLTSVNSSADFYRRMGIYRSGAELLDLPPIDAQPYPVSCPDRIDGDWLAKFSKHWGETRKGGHMVADIRTVLNYIEPRVFTQWREELST